MDFKYTTGFNSKVKADAHAGGSLNISEGSLSRLQPLIPVEVDLERNIDLIGVAFNAAVANTFNKNGDGVDSSTAVAIKDYFIHKPTNIEHNKSRVVGHILKSALSSKGTNEIISEEDALETIGPVNISLGAVVYRTVDQNFADMLEASVDPKSELYNVVSASWEIGFNDYYIALGSKDLSEAEIISDKEQISELSKYLKANDGEGKMDDGTLVNRLVIGNVFPLGIGFTANPAADVKGVFLGEDKKKEKINNSGESAVEIDRIEISSDLFLKKFNKMKKNISQTEENPVSKNNNTKNVMENQNLFEEIKEMLASKLPEKNYTEEAVANIAKVVGDAIKEKSEQFEREKEAALEEQSRAAEAEKAKEEELEELKAQLTDTTQKLEELEAAQKKQADEARFNLRMENVDSEYELSPEDRSILAKEVAEIDETDEAFASYKEKLSVMWLHKNKEHVADQEKAFAEKVEAEVAKKIEDLQKADASETEVSEETQEEEAKTEEEVLDSVEGEQVDVTNNNGETASREEGLRAQFKNTFSKENVTINY